MAHQLRFGTAFGGRWFSTAPKRRTRFSTKTSPILLASRCETLSVPATKSTPSSSSDNRSAAPDGPTGGRSKTTKSNSAFKALTTEAKACESLIWSASASVLPAQRTDKPVPDKFCISQAWRFRPSPRRRSQPLPANRMLSQSLAAPRAHRPAELVPAPSMPPSRPGACRPC